MISLIGVEPLHVKLVGGPWLSPSLLVSILAVVISLGAAGITWAQLRQSGAHLKVEAAFGVTLPAGQRVITVTAVNSGGAPIRVNSITFTIPGAPPERNSVFPTVVAPGSDEMPKRVEGRDQGHWMFPRDSFRSLVQGGGPVELKPWAHTPTGSVGGDPIILKHPL